METAVTDTSFPPLPGNEWRLLPPHIQAVTPILICTGCGATATALEYEDDGGPPNHLAPSEHCGECPPWRCEDCGEMCSAADLCSCWIRLDQMAPADVKALFAEDGMFNVEADGRLTVAEPVGEVGELS